MDWPVNSVREINIFFPAEIQTCASQDRYTHKSATIAELRYYYVLPSIEHVNRKSKKAPHLEPRLK